MTHAFGMFGAMTMLPVMFSQELFTRALQWQREQADALARLVASLTGQECIGGGTVRRRPDDADLFVGKSVSHTKTLTDIHTLFFGLLSLDFNPLHFNEALSRKHTEPARRSWPAPFFRLVALRERPTRLNAGPRSRGTPARASPQRDSVYGQPTRRCRPWPGRWYRATMWT